MMPSPPQPGQGAPPPQPGNQGMTTPPGPTMAPPGWAVQGPRSLPPPGGLGGGTQISDIQRQAAMAQAGGPGGPMPGGPEQQGYMDQFRQFLQFLFGSGALQNAAKQGGPAAPSPSGGITDFKKARDTYAEDAKRALAREAAAKHAGKSARQVDDAVRKILTRKK